jgi:N-acetyl sugar amidotransferase
MTIPRDKVGTQVCSRCVYDTTIPLIRFDDSGVCQFCKIHDEMVQVYPLDGTEHDRLQKLVEAVKKAGRRNRYDCVVGVSGGRDSTYTLLKCVELGLRPLAVHFDNGWNSKIAVQNIESACRKLNVDLETVVADWEEFKDLQISFLKASTSDAEVPTDVSIHAVLHDMAARENIKYLFIGHSFRTEGIVPKGWTYMDGKYIRSVHKKFGKLKKFKSFPEMTLWDVAYSMFVKRTISVPLLNYFDYDKEGVAAELTSKLDWIDYGGHHHESLYTIFFQSYYLPKKFAIDKRKLALSARIRNNKITRAEALSLLQSSKYPEYPEIVDYVWKKLGLTKEEASEIMSAEPRLYLDYNTYYPFLKSMRVPVWGMVKLGIIPEILYYKMYS